MGKGKILSSLKHFFVPSEANNFRARLIHHQFISYFLVLFLIFQFTLSAVLLVKPSVLGFASQILPEKIVELTNQERAKLGAPPLKLNPLLNEAARRKAGDMFAFNYWAHTSPSGRDPWSFFKEVGYRYLYAGENLARDFASAEAVVSAWMASPTHRENILNPKYQEIGVSVVDGTLGGAETTLVVQLFGTPFSQAVAKKSEERVMIPEVAMAEEIPSTVFQKKPEEEELNEERQGEKSSSLAPSLPSSFMVQASGEEQILVNPFSLTKNLGISILGVVALVIIIDGFIIFKRKTLRLSGRSLAHALFLAGTILIIILSTQGRIL